MLHQRRTASECTEELHLLLLDRPTAGEVAVKTMHKLTTTRTTTSSDKQTTTAHPCDAEGKPRSREYRNRTNYAGPGMQLTQNERFRKKQRMKANGEVRRRRATTAGSGPMVSRRGEGNDGRREGNKRRAELARGAAYGNTTPSERTEI